MILQKSELVNINSLTLFTIIVFASILISFLFNTYVLEEDLYFNYFEGQLSYARIEEMLDFREKWSWLSYSLAPLFIFLKFGLISITLITGAFFINLKIEISKIFKIVVISEIIFFIPAILRILWFSFVQTDYTLQDIQYFNPLSLLNLFNSNELDVWWIYPLQLLNFFELVYWIVLAILFANITNESFNRMLGLVIGSYGTGLFIWVIFITFITLNLN